MTIQADPSTLHSILTRQAKALPKPGEVIDLAPAEYDIPIEVNSAWTLRSAQPRSPAIFTKRVGLNARGAKLLQAIVRPGTAGDGFAVGISAPDCEVGWCEVTQFGARGIQIDRGGVGAHVHHNWVHGQLPLTGAGVAGIIAGTGRGTTDIVMKALIEWNLLEDLRAFQGIEFKSEGNTAQYNTLLGGAEIVCRHGDRNWVLANWVENGMIGLAGVNPVAMWNRVTGETPRRGRSAVAIRAGSLPPGAAPQASEYVPALDAIVAGEGADILDGWVKGEGKSWDNAPKGSKARRFRGEVYKGDKPGGVAMDDLELPSRMVPQKLTREMVGPGGSHDPGEPQEPGPVDPPPVAPPATEPEPGPMPDTAAVVKMLEKGLKDSGDLDDRIERIRQKPNKTTELAALNEAEALRTVVRNAIKALKAA